MRTVPTGSTIEAGYTYRKTAGDEPLPGYHLIAPLGHGGFGEVWECEAPGGLHKAIKFVFDDRHDLVCFGGGDTSLSQEAAAVEHIKGIRHPFLLTLERVEQTGPELIVVMELADRNIQDRFDECRADGLAGIPREELLAYFADAAEALDLISARHGLQHLDVKPANLFLVGSHVKVGDYGLVRPHAAGKGSLARGLTPRYVAPEVINGQIDSRSDQYSLALVFQELLTGTFPFDGMTSQALLIQHATAVPDLNGLAPGDRTAIKRALSKDPAERFPSCVALVEALMDPTGVISATETWRDGSGSSMMLRRMRMSRSAVVEFPFTAKETVANAKGLTSPQHPALVTPLRRTPAPPPPVEEEEVVALSPAAPPQGIKLTRIHVVVPITQLTGETGEKPGRPLPAEFVESIVRAACPVAGKLPAPGEIVRAQDGIWTCRFPARTGGGMIPLKLESLKEEWRALLEWPNPTTAIFRRHQAQGFLGKLSGTALAGLEVTVKLPPKDASVGELTATGRLFGTVDPSFALTAAKLLPRMVDDVRKTLGNYTDRRASARMLAGFPMQVFPVSGVGEVMPPVAATCRDVSTGGVCFETTAAIPTTYVYASFGGAAASGWAILTKLMRCRLEGTLQVAGGRFRTDL